MSKTLVSIVAAAVALVSAPLVAAEEHGETNADCEQPYWIGYTTTQTIRSTYYDLVTDEDPQVNTCEGEHWDGQDSVAPGHNPGGGEGCFLTPSTAANGGDDVAHCMNADPNAGSASPTSGNGQLVVFRVSTKRTSSSAEAYVGLDIALVGRVALYNGACTDANGPGLEGEAKCAETGTRTATYLRDNTDQATSGTNVLATLVSAAGLTKGHPSEADCDQATYQQGAVENRRDLCGRDNTAITVETILP